MTLFECSVGPHFTVSSDRFGGDVDIHTDLLALRLHSVGLNPVFASYFIYSLADCARQYVINYYISEKSGAANQNLFWGVGSSSLE